MSTANGIVQLIFISLILLTNIVSAFGQQEYIADVQHYTMKEGLSHRDVLLHFSRQSWIIWVCTKYGLNRFNGRQFQTFTVEKDGLVSNTVSNITEDADGGCGLLMKEIIITTSTSQAFALSISIH